MEQTYNTFSLTWNLDSLFSGGSRSPHLHAAMQKIKHEVLQFKRKFKQLSDLKKGILYFQELDGQSRDLQEYITCLLAQDVNDQEALQLQSQIIELCANCDALGEKLNHLLGELEEDTFHSLLNDFEIIPIAFHLKERRQRTKEKLPVEQEELILQLSKDGYQGWNNLYGSFIGSLRLLSPISSEETLSVSQAENRLSHPDRNIRQAWFYCLEKTWTLHEHLAAQILNHLAGFRLNLYHARKWPSILQEPLFLNRMQEKTLQVMWQTVEGFKDPLQKYLATKAKLLNLKKLSWYDIEAPLPQTNQNLISFDQAAQLIIQSFSAFNPTMGEFAQQIFDKCWIEAEDRNGKRPGGFCASFLHKKESRIFMTYSGTMANVFTLAHELGHAYHSHEVRNLPIFAQQYRMNVAETASTLAEMVVIDALIKKANHPKQQLELIDHKLQRAVIFLMNIHARYLFELDFYQARLKRFVLPQELNHLMEHAQKRAYGEALAEWYPHFWVGKQHFYATDVPFYNFPYTFGYLFSQGIYAHFKQHQPSEELYATLLRDTGCLTVEELAKQHLGVNLQESSFWEHALGLIDKDIESFVKLAEESHLTTNS